MSYVPGNGYPDLATLRAEVGVPATVLPDESLEVIAASEQDGISAGYEWTSVNGELPERLYQVFVRSVARSIAARGAPLGMVGTDAEYGVATLTRRDSEIVRLGGKYRKRTFA